MDDTISRQVAINAAVKMFEAWYGGSVLRDREIRARFDALPPAQPELITKIQNGIKATDADDVYSCGMRNGMRWCISLIDDKEPLYENCPSAQPGCEDAVSRFEVLRLIDYSSHDLNDSVDNRYMQNEIKQLPSVIPKQPGWIPCSERCPDKSEWYLVTAEWDDGFTAVTKDRYVVGEGWTCEVFGAKCLAWCELPTPYREGGQDEQN